MINELNFTTPVNELATAIAEKLAPLFIGIKTQETPFKEVYCTRKETADQPNVSLPTLNEYTKKDLITGYRFGARVLYKQSEIEAALTQKEHGRAGYAK